MEIISGLNMAGYSPYPGLGWSQTACLSEPQIIRKGKKKKVEKEKKNTHDMGAKKKTETTIRISKENRVETARNAVSDQRR